MSGFPRPPREVVFLVPRNAEVIVLPEKFPTPEFGVTKRKTTDKKTSPNIRRGGTLLSSFPAAAAVQKRLARKKKKNINWLLIW